MVCPVVESIEHLALLAGSRTARRRFLGWMREVALSRRSSQPHRRFRSIPSPQLRNEATDSSPRRIATRRSSTAPLTATYSSDWRRSARLRRAAPTWRRRPSTRLPIASPAFGARSRTRARRTIRWCRTRRQSSRRAPLRGRTSRMRPRRGRRRRRRRLRTKRPLRSAAGGRRRSSFHSSRILFSVRGVELFRK